MSTMAPGRLHAVEEAIYATLVRITAPESVGVSLRATAGLLAGTIASLVGAVEDRPASENVATELRPEPEWLTSLRNDMRAELSNLRLATVETYTDRAVGVAASYLHPLYRNLASIREDYEGSETRVAELAENDKRVNALTAQVVRREATISAYETALADVRERWRVTELSAEQYLDALAERARDLRTKDDIVQAKEGEITALTQTIASKDHRISNLAHDLRAQAEVVQELKASSARYLEALEEYDGEYKGGRWGAEVDDNHVESFRSAAEARTGRTCDIPEDVIRVGLEAARGYTNLRRSGDPELHPLPHPLQYLPLSEVTDGHVAAYQRAFKEAYSRNLSTGAAADRINEATRVGLAAIQWPSREVGNEPQSSPEAQELQRRVQELDKDLEDEAAVRDRYHEIADRLAYAIGGQEVGEHSSFNDPWMNALDIASRRASAPSPEMREVPATQSREGDTITMTGKLSTWEKRHTAGSVYVENTPFGDVIIGSTEWTATRPASPLPDKPGAVIRCIAMRGKEVTDAREVVAELREHAWRDTDGWFYDSGDIVRVLDVLDNGRSAD